MNVGKNFEAFAARKQSGRDKAEKAEKTATPLWQRLAACPAPLLLLYGQQDRGAAAERAALAKQRYPGINLHLLDRCKHLVQWDAAEEFVALSTRFLSNY